MEILKEKKVNFKVFEYLKNVPSIKDLRTLTKKLNLKPIDIIRKKDKLFKKLQLNKIKNDNQFIEIIAKNPKLLERPIIVKGEKAIIARPPELIYDFIK